ncbi:heptaprenyl diphosphate synthase component 1 [Bacillus haikouensis]|uniref:heptaprenyl diphosphate synthase component 1 n=1 Tax=Bacillus haikouensis TaxID=1510468 RepID=UPI001551A5D8|nr:heptaprenyl diphosphate synthase component 1 [Bacillus haikouensis]NQD66771.1 heptaprenyl diphosphate synthase component 1 [Bacillus haikouensis]
MKFIDYNHQANIIHQYIEEQLHHSYLKEYIDHPYIDRNRINCLLLPFMNEKRMVTKQEIKWISTAMFLHVALETHEKVTISEQDSLKERQLTVLAGVYFSSLYYKTLADTGDVELIEALSSAIKKINECKISIYKKECTSINELMESVSVIETSIVEHFYEFLQQKEWIPLLSGTLLYNRLLQERLAFENSQKTVFIDALAALLKHPDEPVENHLILSAIEGTMDEIQKDIEIQLDKKEPAAPAVREFFMHFLPFTESLLTTKSYAEEG